MWKPISKGTDPVAEVLGKDIASMIYRLVFQMNIAAVNKQYRKFLIPSVYCGVLFKANILDTGYMFNYCPLELDVALCSRTIHSFKYTDEGWMTRKLKKKYYALH